MSKEESQKNKTRGNIENIIIIFSGLFILNILMAYLLHIILPTAELFSLSGLWISISPYLLIPVAIISIIFLWNKPIVRINSISLDVLLIIIGLLMIYSIIFITYFDIFGIPIATSLKSPALCKLTPYDFNENNCYLNYAIVNKDESFCEKIISLSFVPQTDAKPFCYWKVAVEKRDILLCDKVKESIFYNNCVVGINSNSTYIDYQTNDEYGNKVIVYKNGSRITIK